MFGLEAASVVKVTDQEFYIFGGRVETGETAGVWSLEFEEKFEGQDKGKLEGKS